MNKPWPETQFWVAGAFLQQEQQFRGSNSCTMQTGSCGEFITLQKTKLVFAVPIARSMLEERRRARYLAGRVDANRASQLLWVQRLIYRSVSSRAMLPADWPLHHSSCCRGKAQDQEGEH